MKLPEEHVRAAETGRIYLTGMMGSGKTIVAPYLANMLGYTWVETDRCVERNSGVKIPEFFRRYGETRFRTMEWECLRQTASMRDVVVACGGGAPCYHQAMQWMLDQGIVVYLSAGPETLTLRLMEGRSTRPLLSDGDVHLDDRIAGLLAEREPHYRQAHLEIATDGLTPQEVAKRIVESL